MASKAARCSFSNIITDAFECGPCITPEHKLVNEVIPLVNCKKEIFGHMRQFQLSRSEIETEVELILCRAGMY